MITLTMIIWKSIVLFLAIFTSIFSIGHICAFCVNAVKVGKAEFTYKEVIMPALFWAIFYFLTF